MSTEPKSDEKGAPRSLTRGLRRRQDTKSKDLPPAPGSRETPARSEAKRSEIGDIFPDISISTLTLPNAADRLRYSTGARASSVH